MGLEANADRAAAIELAKATPLTFAEALTLLPIARDLGEDPQQLVRDALAQGRDPISWAGWKLATIQSARRHFAARQTPPRVRRADWGRIQLEVQRAGREWWRSLRGRARQARKRS